MGRRPALILAMFYAAVVFSIPATARTAEPPEEWDWVAEIDWLLDVPEITAEPPVQLEAAYALEQKGSYEEAASRYFYVLRKHPKWEQAGIALQRLAKCLYDLGYYHPAFRAVEQVIETYPESARLTDLVEIEKKIARRCLSTVVDGTGFPADSERGETIRSVTAMLGAVIAHNPSGPEAAELHVAKGECHLLVGEVTEAREDFKIVVDDFPDSQFVKRARLGLRISESL